MDLNSQIIANKIKQVNNAKMEQFNVNKIKFTSKLETALDKIYQEIIHRIEVNHFVPLNDHKIKISFKFGHKGKNIPIVNFFMKYCTFFNSIDAPSLGTTGLFDYESKKTYNFKYFFGYNINWNEYALNYIHNKYPTSGIINEIKITERGHGDATDKNDYYSGYYVSATITI